MSSGIGDGIQALMILLLVAGLAIGALAAWLIPMLWHWVKPMIHALTA